MIAEYWQFIHIIGNERWLMIRVDIISIVVFKYRICSTAHFFTQPITHPLLTLKMPNYFTCRYINDTTAPIVRYNNKIFFIRAEHSLEDAPCNHYRIRFLNFNFFCLMVLAEQIQRIFNGKIIQVWLCRT
ncbi:MAG: hypothetical protein DYG96_11925 [Chlorobi bacterium CHB2]|nr:hypothetical protein [Chlorobi bacterium CHB2]